MPYFEYSFYYRWFLHTVQLIIRDQIKLWFLITFAHAFEQLLYAIQHTVSLRVRETFIILSHAYTVITFWDLFFILEKSNLHIVRHINQSRPVCLISAFYNTYNFRIWKFVTLKHVGSPVGNEEPRISLYGTAAKETTT